jgi:hypothetical protein
MADRGNREDAPNGELGVDRLQLKYAVGEDDRSERADNEDHQGNQDGAHDGDQSDQQNEEEPDEEQVEKANQVPRGSSGAGQRVDCPDLKLRIRELERLVIDLTTAVKGKGPGGSFQGVKLKPADPPKFGGGKEVVKDLLATRCGGGYAQAIAQRKTRSSSPRPFSQEGLQAFGELRVQHSKLRALISRIGMSLPGL